MTKELQKFDWGWTPVSPKPTPADYIDLYVWSTDLYLVKKEESSGLRFAAAFPLETTRDKADFTKIRVLRKLIQNDRSSGRDGYYNIDLMQGKFTEV